MNFRAQAGLEYLMTYGWALVIIVTVVGVLFTVVNPPSNQVSFSVDSRNFIVKSSNTVSGSPPTFTVEIMNISGKQISISQVTTDNFTLTYPTCETSCAISISSGQSVKITGSFSSYPDSGTIAVSYRMDSYNKTMSILAKGKIAGSVPSSCGDGVCEAAETCTADNSSCITPPICYSSSSAMCIKGCKYPVPIVGGSPDPGRCDATHGSQNCPGGVDCVCDGDGTCIYGPIPD